MAHWCAASERNKVHICNVLKQVYNANQIFTAVEIAAGYGQHVCLFAKEFLNSTWYPTDVDSAMLIGLRENIQKANLPNIKHPTQLDVSVNSAWKDKLQLNSCDLVVNINMIHISSHKATEGLFYGASTILKENGLLLTYGPYSVNGLISPDSNIQFHQWLKQRNSEWGLRDVTEMEVLAQNNCLKLEKTIDMPANNKILLFRKLP